MLVEIANLNLPHLYLAIPKGVTPLEFRRDFYFWHQKTRVPWAIVWRCLRYPTFSRFGTVPACDRQTDRQTDRHMTIAYAALAQRHAGKNVMVIKIMAIIINCAWYIIIVSDIAIFVLKGDVKLQLTNLIHHWPNRLKKDLFHWTQHTNATRFNENSNNATFRKKIIYLFMQYFRFRSKF